MRGRAKEEREAKRGDGYGGTGRALHFNRQQTIEAEPSATQINTERTTRGGRESAGGTREGQTRDGGWGSKGGSDKRIFT